MLMNSVTGRVSRITGEQLTRWDSMHRSGSSALMRAKVRQWLWGSGRWTITGEEMEEVKAFK